MFLLAGSPATCLIWHFLKPISSVIWGELCLKSKAKPIFLTKGKMLNKIFKFFPLQIQCFQPVPYDRTGSQEFTAHFSCLCSFALQLAGVTARAAGSASLQEWHLASSLIPANLPRPLSVVSWSQTDGSLAFFRKEVSTCVAFKFCLTDSLTKHFP